MGTFRTKNMAAVYDAFIAQGGLAGACPLCVAPTLATFKYWKIMNNKFPYDKVATMHHMLVPLQHVTEASVSREAWMEYQELKKGILNQDYEFLVEATTKKKSIPAHFHIHLLVAQD
ncbi:hypothetical protein H7X87_04090 [Acetobacteraceae bacterium]|nr:hypothetical protein [Candidatus Parcubacteria bacterium]